MIKTFEESLPEIDVEIRKRKNKWTLTAINWLDYDDVAQIIRLHIYNKWHLYDHVRPLSHWVNKVISSQIRNLIRNNYSSFARPCLRCPAAQGENLCSIYGVQCAKCPLYKKWVRTKKSAYDTRLPLSMEDHGQEVSNKQDQFLDLTNSINNLHIHMKTILKPNEYKLYSMLYIEHIEEDEAAIKMGFKTKEKGRSPGYKQIKNLKKSIIDKAKKALSSEEIDII